MYQFLLGSTEHRQKVKISEKGLTKSQVPNEIRCFSWRTLLWLLLRQPIQYLIANLQLSKLFSFSSVPPCFLFVFFFGEPIVMIDMRLKSSYQCSLRICTTILVNRSCRNLRKNKDKKKTSAISSAYDTKMVCIPIKLCAGVVRHLSAYNDRLGFFVRNISIRFRVGYYELAHEKIKSLKLLYQQPKYLQNE